MPSALQSLGQFVCSDDKRNLLLLSSLSLSSNVWSAKRVRNFQRMRKMQKKVLFVWFKSQFFMFLINNENRLELNATILHSMLTWHWHKEPNVMPFSNTRSFTSKNVYWINGTKTIASNEWTQPLNTNMIWYYKVDAWQ